MPQLTPGSIVRLTVDSVIATAYILKGSHGDVILPKRTTEQAFQEGEEVEVFLYEDKQGRLTASATLPTVTLDAYDWAEVVEKVEHLGVFVNIGIEKDILVSKDDLPFHKSVWPQKKDHLFVCLINDKKGKLMAKPISETIINKERDKAPKDMLHQPVSGHVYRASKIGSFIITEEGYRGFIHHSERKKEPRMGQSVKGRVIDVKDDGTLNISLRPRLIESRDEDAEHLLNYLQNNDGEIALTDKSSPDEIKEVLHISKAAFKRAVGKLLKEKKITQENGVTRLIESE
ncbi:hypothetical protein HXZ66_10710 [Bacillus sp. A116_S68]|nr:hypothetical protein HXZ66_10710 [Bacillus sp. A116_S68]